MRVPLRRSLVVLVTVLVAVLCAKSRALAAALPDATALSSTIRIDDAGAVFIPVQVNGAGPFVFLVDTGAASSAVTDTLARALHLAAAGRTIAATTAGDAACDLVQTASLTAAGRETTGVRLVVLPASHMAAAAPGAVGILGQDVLSQASFTIDYARGRFSWSTPERMPRAGQALPMKWVDGQWLAHLPQKNGGDGGVWMVADSGSSALVLFDHGAGVSSALSVAPLAVAGRVSTVAGAGTARGVVLKSFTAGPSTLRDVPAIVTDRRTEADGLLPLCLFARVTFDVTAGRLIVEGR